MTCSPEILFALGTLGVAWARTTRRVSRGVRSRRPRRPGQDLSRLVQRMRLVNGRYMALDPMVDALFPHGLTTAQALGFTFSALWSAGGPGTEGAIVESPESRRSTLWSIHLPAPGVQPLLLTAAKALPIVCALQVIRRATVPRTPWGPRDVVAGELERAARLMAASLRPPTPVQVLRPEVNRSDLGRDWSGRYDARG